MYLFLQVYVCYQSHQNSDWQVLRGLVPKYDLSCFLQHSGYEASHHVVTCGGFLAILPQTDTLLVWIHTELTAQCLETIIDGLSRLGVLQFACSQLLVWLQR